MLDDWKRRLDAVHAELVSADDPVAWVTEADAVNASQRYPHLVLRGPVFGVAVQDPAVGPEWRLLLPVVDGMPQQARDGLQSHLFFKAKDDTDDPAVRRELMAAVAVLEREPANEVEALGARYRVVRGDEFAREGKDGLEPPRPTDREPADRTWGGNRRTPSPDVGFVCDPGRDDGLMAAALKLSLRDFAYTGSRFTAEMRADSRRAAAAYPDIALLPIGFGVAENDGTGWRQRGAMMPTPHDARDLLYNGMSEIWPVLYRFDEDEKAAYTKVAEEFRAAGHANEARMGDTLYRICRIERLVRCGPDGPEPARASDADEYGPMKMHPSMDEDGTLHYD
ncbi:DUF5954 family protein [Streptomyces palmae]|uniref:Aromatic ring-opening dioxygenase LigA n=1 Tax=Streptomyces palmae TaxID=1701085 RepID=A0A4Z0FR29_9ACTN|nr:DUF5954 family protein [Streptomyces palmae]TGA84278.1 hypothetical protein E4099_31515 [Streptomyces palmae]